MFSKFLKLTILALVMFTSFTANAALPPRNYSMAGWIATGVGSGIYENVRYNLWNLNQRAFLRYQDRWGANLAWTNLNPNYYMKVKRLRPSTGPIKCGEPFALFIQKEWFIYGKQAYGVNLTSSAKLSSPSMYQWRFTKCGANGIADLRSEFLTLVNNVNNTSLVGCTRTFGVNLCWSNDVVQFKSKNYRYQDLLDLVARGLAPRDILKYLCDIFKVCF